MRTRDIVIGRRALVQTGVGTKEHVKIKAINKVTDRVIIRLSNGELTEINAEYIIKDFKS